MSDSFEITVQQGVTVVKLSQKLASAYESIIAELGGLVEAAESVEPPQMLVDLSSIEYCGSAFVGFLFKLAGTLNRREGRFGVANPNTFTKMVLTTTKSEEMFSIFDSVDDGIATIAG